MGRRDRKTAKSFRPLEKANDSVAISKQKKLEREEEFLDKFEERQNVIPAVLLKSGAVSKAGHPGATSTPMDRKGKQNKQRNDGNSAVHHTVKQMVDERSAVAKGNGESHRHKGKRKITFSSESSGSEKCVKTYEQEREVGNQVGKGSRTLKKCLKMAIESDSDAISADDDLTDGQFPGDGIAEEDEEESLDDEEIGDDLEDEELEQADADELRNGDLEDEEGANSSFFTSDEESLEDQIGDDSDEEPSEVVEFIGYQSTAKSAKCLVLEALKDYTTATSPYALFKFSNGADHSVKVATKALQWVVGPIDSQTFFNDLFQKRALVINRKSRDYFEGFFGTSDLFEMLQKFDMDFGTDVNVSLYEKGEMTINNDMECDRATAAAIWEHIGRGRTAQFVRLQRFNDNIWYLCEVLQELFCSVVGANCYLTSPNSGGIAPHWEDNDAFLLQVEGRHYFKVYSPANDEVSFPLESGDHLAESDFEGREPTFEGWLKQGDTLYIPRGWTYQAHAGDVHSLQVIVSFCRRHTFADFLEKASAEFVKTLVLGSKHLRQTMPPLLLDMAGVSGNDYSGEQTLEEKIIPVFEIFSRKFGESFASYLPSYVDLMAREFIRLALPPILTPEEKTKICFGEEIGSLLGIGKETEVRLVRKHTQRLLFENTEKAFVVHRMANSRSCEDYPEKIIDFPVEFEDGFITLTDSYPNWVKVRELGLESEEANVKLAKLLYRNGLLLVQRGETFGEEKEGGKGDEEGGKEEQQQKAEEGDNKSSKKNKRKRRKRKKGDGDTEGGTKDTTD